jgi:hypothetical protein
MILDRNIITKKGIIKDKTLDFEENGIDQNDKYINRLVKLIPAEVIAFYLALDGIVSNMNNKETLLWIVFIVSAVGAWVYIVKENNVKKIPQQFLTILSFCIWVFVIGGPFQMYDWYDVNYGKLLVTAYTFFVPLFYKPAQH